MRQMNRSSERTLRIEPLEFDERPSPQRAAPPPFGQAVPTSIEFDRSLGWTDEPEPVSVHLKFLSDIFQAPLEQIWGNVVTSGAVTVLAGEAGIGKSSVAVHIAAAVTRGQRGPQAALSDQQPVAAGGERLRVWYCSPFCERSRVLARRLRAAGADLSLVQTMTGIGEITDDPHQESSQSFQLDRDLAILEEELTWQQGGVAEIGLVVIDPFPVVPVAGTRQAAKLYELASRLAELADRCEVAVLLVCDALPLSDPKRGTSITPYPGVERAAQSVWVVEQDPDSESRRLLLPSKSILEETPPALAFTRQEGRLTWEAESLPLTAKAFRQRTLQRGRNPLQCEEATELARATDWLQKRLADGPVRSWLIKQEAHENEISYATLRRAFCALRCQSTRIESSRHHHWVATGDLHARRLTGSESEGRSRVEGTTGEDVRGMVSLASHSGLDPVQDAPDMQVRAHDEHVLEHQLEHVLEPIKQGDFGVSVIDAQCSPHSKQNDATPSWEQHQPRVAPSMEQPSIKQTRGQPDWSETAPDVEDSVQDERLLEHQFEHAL